MLQVGLHAFFWQGDGGPDFAARHEWRVAKAPAASPKGPANGTRLYTDAASATRLIIM
jgi:hypothetical protein